MKFKTLAATLLCSVALFCGCAKDTDVVLKVNDQTITRAEFYSDFDRIKNLQFKNAPKEIQKENSYPMLSLKDKYTNDVIIRTLLAQEFEKRKIQASEQEIKDKKAQIVAQIGSQEQFDNILKENGITQERLNSDMANEVKIDKLAAQVAPKVSEKDVKKYYEDNKQQFSLPERVSVAHILIDTNPENIKRKLVDADKEAKLSSNDIDKRVKEEVEKQEKLAVELQAKAAKNPKIFAQLAKEYSTDKATAEKGGDLGYVMSGQMVKEFEEAAFKQKVGTVGPLVKSQYGTHIIYVKDKAAKGIQPYAKVKADLEKYLTMQKRFESLQKLIEGLKSSANIEYVDESLNPDVLKKQLDEAIKKQTEKEKKEADKKSFLDKMKKDKKD